MIHSYMHYSKKSRETIFETKQKADYSRLDNFVVLVLHVRAMSIGRTVHREHGRQSEISRATCNCSSAHLKLEYAKETISAATRTSASLAKIAAHSEFEHASQAVRGTRHGCNGLLHQYNTAK